MSGETGAPAVSSKKDPYAVESILRACDVLRAFRMENEELRLREVIERTGLHKATAYRTLRTLIAGGLIERIGDERYRSQMKALNQRRLRFGYAAMTGQSAFSREVTDGIRRAAVNGNIELVELDNQYSAKVALRNAETLVRERVDFAIEVQIHEDIAPLIAAKFADAQIPAIAVDIPQPGATFFGGNNYAAGRIGGAALAHWAQKNWDGNVDYVLLLKLGAAGPLPQSRMMGVATGIQEVLRQIREPQIVVLDGKGGFMESMEAVRKHLRRVRGGRFLIGAMNDASALGALRAFEEAGRLDASAVMGMNGTAAARAELRRAGSRLVGSVAFFPETYGDQIVPLALSIIQKKLTPPAMYVKHALITAANVDRYYPADESSDHPDSNSMLFGHFH